MAGHDQSKSLGQTPNQQGRVWPTSFTVWHSKVTWQRVWIYNCITRRKLRIMNNNPVYCNLTAYLWGSWGLFLIFCVPQSHGFLGSADVFRQKQLQCFSYLFEFFFLLRHTATNSATSKEKSWVYFFTLKVLAEVLKLALIGPRQFLQLTVFEH